MVKTFLTNFHKIITLAGILLSSAQSINAVEPGYRSYVEYEYLRGFEEFKGANLNGISTSLGYQITPIGYVGVGVGYQFFKFHELDRKTHYNIPLYADFRLFFGEKSTVFINIKMGASVGGIGNGFYTNPSVGYHIQLGESYGLNLAIGYSFLQAESNKIKGNTFNMSGINFKFGFDI